MGRGASGRVDQRRFSGPLFRRHAFPHYKHVVTTTTRSLLQTPETIIATVVRRAFKSRFSSYSAVARRVSARLRLFTVPFVRRRNRRETHTDVVVDGENGLPARNGARWYARVSLLRACTYLGLVFTYNICM